MLRGAGCAPSDACACLCACLQVRNEKARRFLLNMRKKPGIPFEQHFPRASAGALRLLRRLLAFDPVERPTAGEPPPPASPRRRRPPALPVGARC